MRRKTGLLQGMPLTIACLALIVGTVFAMEKAPTGKDTAEGASKADETFVSCTAWLNCESRSPNYTGICCRSCEDANGQRQWQCKKLSAEGDRPGASPAGEIALGEATLAGIVTAEGILHADDGHDYTVVGEDLKAERLRGNMGKRIQVKGTVQEQQGKVSIDVESYEFLHSEEAGTSGGSKRGLAFGSCTAWMNCDQRPPNYTGTCCRQCDDKRGGNFWDCRAFSEGEHFDLADWSPADAN